MHRVPTCFAMTNPYNQLVILKPMRQSRKFSGSKCRIIALNLKPFRFICLLQPTLTKWRCNTNSKELWRQHWHPMGRRLLR
jgi:hypothetical protein